MIPKLKLPGPLIIESLELPTLKSTIDGDDEKEEPHHLRFDGVACSAIGLAHEDDIAAGTIDGMHHNYGKFRIKDVPAAINAVVGAYRIATERSQFFTFREYVNACDRSETLHNQKRQQEKELDRWLNYTGDNRPPQPRSILDGKQEDFLQSFSHDHYTPDYNGYILYVATWEPKLASLLKHEIRAFVPEKARLEHSYVVGASGYGKSELLKVIIHGYVTRPDYGSVVALDPGGDFVAEIAKWQEFVGSNRLIFVRHDLARSMTPTINPLEISGVDPADTSREAVKIKQVVAQQLVGGLQEVIGSGQGAQFTLPMRTLLMPCILTLLDRPGSTLRDLQRFMNSDVNQDLIEFGASRSHYPDVETFFASGAFGKERYGVTKGSIYTKLQDLFNTGVFAELTCGPSTIDLEYAINNRKVILFDLGKGSVGEEEGRAFGRLIVAMLQGIAMRRVNIPKHKRVPCHLIIDECHNFISRSVEDIYRETRKFRLYLTLCQQIVGDNMGTDIAKIVLGNSNVQFGGYAQPNAQAATAKLLSVDASDVGALNKGDFFVRMGNNPSFRMHVRSDLLSFANSMTGPSWRRLVKKQLGEYYRPARVRETTIKEDGSSPQSGPKNELI